MLSACFYNIYPLTYIVCACSGNMSPQVNTTDVCFIIMIIPTVRGGYWGNRTDYVNISVPMLHRSLDGRV